MSDSEYDRLKAQKDEIERRQADTTFEAELRRRIDLLSDGQMRGLIDIAYLTGKPFRDSLRQRILDALLDQSDIPQLTFPHRLPLTRDKEDKK